MKPIIEVKNLSKTFQQSGKKAFRAVDGVNFEVYPGKLLELWENREAEKAPLRSW